MNEKLHQTITLNVTPYLSEREWAKVWEVYCSMDGWIDAAECPSWYGTDDADRYITVSVEPSGLLFDAHIESKLWTGWLTSICARLTLALGVAVHDAEI
ncbi:hypothetical protein ACETRX_30185 [Labrys portucalensis]|uniref:SRPBCC domain-containing protein n=1 Tax=Labrys neptuniae TaxID=376174 RepID=A0ABV6ZP59_9HYPH